MCKYRYRYRDTFETGVSLWVSPILLCSSIDIGIGDTFSTISLSIIARLFDSIANNPGLVGLMDTRPHRRRSLLGRGRGPCTFWPQWAACISGSPLLSGYALFYDYMLLTFTYFTLTSLLQTSYGMWILARTGMR